MTKRALVCGAGISGLSIGIALKRMGWEVSVFDKDSELRVAGAGLNLWPNGVRVLRELGLGPRYQAISASLDYYRTFSADGKVVAVDDLRDWPDRYGAPLSGVYRRDLSAMLVDALGRERLHLGRKVVGVEQRETVICRFENGEAVEGDVLIGADGINSAVRTSLFGQQEFSSDGLTRWRGLFDLANVNVDPRSEGEVWGSDGHLGYLPIGKGRAYWYATARGITDDPAKAREHFRAWEGSAVPSLICATELSSMLRNELHEFVRPLPHWSKGRITLMGDAAHPMLPGMAQGANQALEDVRALSRALDSHEDIEIALQAYEQERIPWVAPVVRYSRSLFDFDERHDMARGSQNPLLDRYENIVERKNG
ncbi:MAG: FAD-dependent monooxygenase [Parvibaculaceae bacterium]